MSEESPTESAAPPVDGSVYLYEQPQLLSVREHGQLNISQGEARYEFTRNVRLVPMVFSEIASAQKHYPVVFSELNNPQPVAVLGVLADVNLFLDAAGSWDRDTYIPSYLRRYPFALARRNSEQFSLVIDRAASMITEAPGLPLFDGEEPSETTQRMMEFCRQYDAAHIQTQRFAARLQELELLIEQQVTHKPDDASEPLPLANYVTVDTSKLQELAPESLQSLHQEGYLASIYAHVFSLENWNRLLARRVAQQTV